MPRKKIAPGYILAKQKIQNGKRPFNRDQVADAAAELGSMGGQVGGPARADALTAKQRSKIARYAAMVRWLGRDAAGEYEP